MLKNPSTMRTLFLLWFACLGSIELMAQVPYTAPLSSHSAVNGTVDIPAGDRIDVVLTSDVGSRLGKLNDRFAVQTATDYYVAGRLILPKGSPGYGMITHVKSAASWHAGGELAIQIDHLVLPNGKPLLVRISGDLGGAKYSKEQNGSSAGRWLLCGWLCMQSKKGDDMLLKTGTHLYVQTLLNSGVPVALPNASPAPSVLSNGSPGARSGAVANA